MRPLTDRYTVSPQIDPADVAAIAAAGYTTLINNRPCVEIPPSHQADVMEQAAKEAGLHYVVLPITHDTLGPDLAQAQRDIIDASNGPVFAYCASGTRCTIVWALGQAGDMAVDDIIATAQTQGYDLSMMRPHLSQLSGQ
ncbi:Beta-lactamase hydrolase-like protein [Pseudooctadecabacter jejudonensis]|uniref:Beta-lactamase hydrolase-like protein n=2 Tax=Pseudooctadecabacter jejudonensis TaxID=1391910 RepID=A0A1Y5TFK5_9RHOB|nr:Beta-lactamase hydrolase-like protein [Pseudooctadecabacter jejudonensis]